MADVKQRHVAHVYTTPSELRELATLMEKKWRSSLLGDDLTVMVWSGTASSFFDIHIVCDQALMRQSDSRNAPDKT